MTREEFFKKSGRLGLIAILVLIAVTLGNRMVAGSACSKCPGKDVCNGESDCNKY